MMLLSKSKALGAKKRSCRDRDGGHDSSRPHPPSEVPKVVLEVEREMAADAVAGRLFHEYHMFEGVPEFVSEAADLVLGGAASSPALREGRAGACQSYGGSGALRVALNMASLSLGLEKAYLPENKEGGVTPWTADLRLRADKFLFDDGTALYGRAADLLSAQCGRAAVVLDVESEFWDETVAAVKEMNLFLIVTAFELGLKSGNLDDDAERIRNLDRGGDVEFLACVSFGRNMGLTEHRTGAVVLVAKEKSSMAAAMNQLVYGATFTSGLLSPKHGAVAAARLLADGDKKKEWEDYLKGQALRRQ